MADMHICDRCGKPTPNYTKYVLGSIDGRDGCSVCDDCKQHDLELAWENEQWRKDYITMPVVRLRRPRQLGVRSGIRRKCGMPQLRQDVLS